MMINCRFAPSTRAWILEASRATVEVETYKPGWKAHPDVAQRFPSVARQVAARVCVRSCAEGCRAGAFTQVGARYELGPAGYWRIGTAHARKLISKARTCCERSARSSRHRCLVPQGGA